jgi:hypothetical protein
MQLARIFTIGALSMKESWEGDFEERVGMGGFEPPTSRTLSECANRTALHPE